MTTKPEPTEPTHPFRGGRQAKPTMKHRPAIWECMLGTVYARNDAGKVMYFDYDYAAARAFANVEGRDLRTYRVPRAYGSTGHMGPRAGALVLWVK